MAADDGQAGPVRPSPRRPGWALPGPVDMWLAAAVYVVTLAARWPLLDGPLHGDEAAHFYVARHWGLPLHEVYPETPNTAALWWQRPLFSIVLAPGAAFSFEAYRAWHAVLAGLAVPLVFANLRAAGASRPWAVGTAALAGLLPHVAVWHARVFPDALLTVWLLGAILAWQTGRRLVAAPLLVAAAWTKEPGYLAVAAYAATAWWQELKTGVAGVWPLRLGKTGTAALAAGLAAPLPLAVSLVAFNGRRPGWSIAALSASTAEALVASIWIGAILLLGLMHRRTRRWAAVGLLYPAAYMSYGLLGGGVDAWYSAAPAVLAVLAAAAVLAMAWRNRPAGIPRWTRTAGLAAVFLLGLAWVAAPAGSVVHDAALPLSPERGSFFQDAARIQGAAGIDDAWARVTPEERGTVFLVDVGWFYILYPAAEEADVVGFAYTEHHGALQPWVDAIETNGDVTLLQPIESPLNRAIRDTYADCLRVEVGGHWLIEGRSCAGRGDELLSRFEAYGGQASR